jgi:hypothetical protein
MESHHPHDTASAAECGSAVLDSVRSIATDDLLERLSSVAAAAELPLLAPPAPASHSLPPPRTPYRPTPLDRLRHHLLGPEVQLACQIAAGVALTGIFVFLDEARFKGACVAATLFLVAAVQSSPMAHVGNRVGAAASFLGALWVGTLLAGAVASAARALAMTGASALRPASSTAAPEPALTLALSLLSAPFLLLFAAVRMAPSPPALQGTGLSLTLFFGLPVIESRAAQSHAQIWQGVVAGQFTIGLAAIGAALVVSLLVLPSLASDAVEDAVSRALRAAGQSLSRTSARVFSPPEASAEAVAAALERKRSREASKRGGVAYWAALREQEQQKAERGSSKEVGGGSSSCSDEEEDEAEGDGGNGAVPSYAAAAAIDRGRQAPDAWVLAAGDDGPGGAAATPTPPPPPLSPVGRPRATADTIASVRPSSFVQAARMLPPRPVPGVPNGAIAMEREPDDVPGFFEWWDVVSAPVEEPAEARKQRRRRELALRARREHRARLAESAEARAREVAATAAAAGPGSNGSSGGATTTTAAAATKSPFAAAAATAAARGDLEQQQQQEAAWEQRAYVEALKNTAAGRVPAHASPNLLLLSPNLLDLGAPGPPIAGLRPLLGAARVAAAAAALEPDCLRRLAGRRRRFDKARWLELIAAIEALVTRLSALEAVAEDGGGLNERRQVWLAPMLAAKRHAFAEAAACLAVLSEAAAPGRTAAAVGGKVCGAEQLFGRSWDACRDELKEGLRVQVESFVLAVREAVAEAAVVAAAGDDKQQQKQQQQQETQKPRLVLYSGYNARIHFFAFVVTTAVLDAMQRVDDAGRAALCPVRLREQRQRERDEEREQGGWRRRLRLPRLPFWASELAGMVAMLPAARHLASLARWPWSGLAQQQQHPTLPTAHRPRRPILPREAVAAIKYSLAAWLALTATLFALAYSDLARQLAPVYGFVAVAIATTERVEATASRVVSWILGTAVGATLGFAIMSPPALASSAAGLLVLLAAFAFAVSLLGLTTFRTTIVLSLMTLSALVLCQYTDGCRLAVGASASSCVPHGTVDVFAARVCAVAAGVLLSQAVTSLLAPWYTSDWSLLTMATALRDSAAPFFSREFERFFDDGRRAYEASMAAAAGGGGGGGAGSGMTTTTTTTATRTASGQLTLAEAAEAAEAMARAATLAARRATGAGGGEEGEDTPPPPAPPPPPPPPAAPDQSSAPAVRALQSGLAAPLVAVQLSLARDAVQWRRGVLATPARIPLVLRSMLSLLDRLAALEITLQVSDAPITGRFTGVAFRHYFLPMEQAWREVVRAADELAAATAAHLVAAADRGRFSATEEGGGGGGFLDGGRSSSSSKATRCNRTASSRDALLRALAGLQASRRKARAAQVAARQAHVVAMARAPSDAAALAEFLAPDDTLRFLAFVTAWIKALNRLESVARAALSDGCGACGRGRGGEEEEGGGEGGQGGGWRHRRGQGGSTAKAAASWRQWMR